MSRLSSQPAPVTSCLCLPSTGLWVHTVVCFLQTPLVQRHLTDRAISLPQNSLLFLKKTSNSEMATFMASIKLAAKEKIK